MATRHSIGWPPITSQSERSPCWLQARIVIGGAGVEDVNGEYVATAATEVPRGFDLVCQQQSWDTRDMWLQLGAGLAWYKAQNGAYIYWNASDKHWWIDQPDGSGVYKAVAPKHSPPQVGWKLLGDGVAPAPNMVATFRDGVKA